MTQCKSLRKNHAGESSHDPRATARSQDGTRTTPPDRRGTTTTPATAGPRPPLRKSAPANAAWPPGDAVDGPRSRQRNTHPPLRPAPELVRRLHIWFGWAWARRWPHLWPLPRPPPCLEDSCAARQRTSPSDPVLPTPRMLEAQRPSAARPRGGPQSLKTAPPTSSGPELAQRLHLLPRWASSLPTRAHASDFIRPRCLA